MTKKTKNSSIGSSFEDFLHEEGTYEEVTDQAIKQVLARQIARNEPTPHSSDTTKAVHQSKDK